MMQHDPNYGRQQEHPDAANRNSSMRAQDEKTWSVLSHLSILLGFVGLMPLGALAIWLVYKDRSPKVGFHALQSLWYQLAWYVIWLVGGIVGVVFTVLTLGLGLILVLPLAFVLWLAPFAHGLYAAYKVNRGVDYRYPFVADAVDGGRRTSRDW